MGKRGPKRPTCSIEGCNKPHYGRSFCSRHYMKWRKWGDPLVVDSEMRRISKLGEKNPQWKGNRVGYSPLHQWIRTRLRQPANCSLCGVHSKLLDLANKSGNYERDVGDWQWLCRLCHMKSDGRLKALIERNKHSRSKVAEGELLPTRRPGWLTVPLYPRNKNH